MRIGFIGLGTMGRNAAASVLRAGFDLVGYDIRAEAIEPLLAKGALGADSPADVLDRCDAVVTMVFGPKEIEQVLRGPYGFLSTSCAGKIWIDMTTSSPRLMRELAAEFQAKGGRPVDAPVTGSVDSAIRADMLMFVGGEDADVEAARPILEAMGQIRRVGNYGEVYERNVGSGSKLGIPRGLNQLWSAGGIQYAPPIR